MSIIVLANPTTTVNLTSYFEAGYNISKEKKGENNQTQYSVKMQMQIGSAGHPLLKSTMQIDER